MATNPIRKQRKKFIKRMHTEKRSTLLKFLTFEEQDIIVDWQALENQRNDLKQNQQDYENVLKYLEHKGILRLGLGKGSFTVLGSDMNLSPETNYKDNYSFARQEDAIAYAETRYKNATYPVRVSEIKTNILNKKA